MIKFSYPMYEKDVITALDLARSKAGINAVLNAVLGQPRTFTGPDGTRTLDAAAADRIVRYARMRFGSVSSRTDDPEFSDPRKTAVRRGCPSDDWARLKKASQSEFRKWRSAAESASRRLLADVAFRDLVRRAAPYVVEVHGISGTVPPEFSDWTGRRVDLHMEQLVFDPAAGLDRDAVTRIMDHFLNGGIIAFKKGGRWFAIAMVSRGLLKSVAIRVEPIAEAEAAEYDRLPYDWEQKVTLEDL